MNDNPYESPDESGKSPPPARGATRLLVNALVVMAVIGIAVALFLPAVRTSRGPARRMSCANNLKQIALALQGYESVYHSLPPAYTVDEAGRPLHSWRTLILPFVEQKALYEKIDLSKPWDDPVNEEAYETSIPSYRCPSTECPPGHTTYLAIVAEGGCFRATEPRKLSDITDDLQLTLIVVEVDDGRHVHWMSPMDASEQWILSLGTQDDLPHLGVQAACVEGNVLYLSSGIPATKLRALISIDGNDDEIADSAH